MFCGTSSSLLCVRIPTTMMSTIKFMTAALLLLDLSSFVIAQTSNGNCNSAECVYKVNCSFVGDEMCAGWTNLKGSDSLDWLTNDTCPRDTGDECLTVDFTNAPANSRATLESPCMCATDLNASILSFEYAIPGAMARKNCPLSVYLTTNTIISLLWNSTEATLNQYKQAQIEISSPDHPFKILIEGKTTDNEPCAKGGNKTRIDNIIYEGVAPSTLSPPESTATSKSKSLSTVDTSPIPSAISLATSGGQGSLAETKAEETLDVGVAAGIGVGAVALIALIVALLLYLWKRRTRKDETNSQLASEETANTDTLETVVDPSYQADNDHTAEDGNTTADESNKPRLGISHYEVVDVQDLHPIYTEPDDAVTPTNAHTLKPKEGNLETKSPTVSESSEVLYAKPVKPKGPGKDILKQHSESTKSEKEVEKPKGSEQNNYNKLVLQNPRAKRIDQLDSTGDGSGLTATPSLSNARSLQGARPHPGDKNVDLSKSATSQPDHSDVYNRLDKERPITPAVNPDVVVDTGLVYNRLNEVAPVNPAEPVGQGSSGTDTRIKETANPDVVDTGLVYNRLNEVVTASTTTKPDSEGQGSSETEELYLNTDHIKATPKPRSDSGGAHHALDKDRPKERPNTPAANVDGVVDTGLVYNRINEVTPMTAQKAIKPDGAGHGSSTAGSKRRETEELYMNVDHDGVKPVPRSDSGGHKLNKDRPKERPTKTDAKPDAADTGLLYNRLNAVAPATAPITTQPGRAGQASSSAGPKRRGTEELYMNVDHDGVKPVPRPESGGVYHQLEFDAKGRDQANAASDVYDRTA